MNNEVCIVCDWKGANPFPTFIEAEVDGRSVKFDWRDRSDGLKELVIPTTPPAGARDAVTDDMVERACAAFYSDLAWRTNSNQSRDFMRAALEAALAGKADGETK